MSDLMNKHRPKVFGEVVGQDFVKKVLQKHLAKDEYMSSYMFEGPYGSGKCLDGSTLGYLKDEVIEIGKLWNRFIRQGFVPKNRDSGEYIEVDLELEGIAGFVKARYFYREREVCQRVTFENGMSITGSLNQPLLLLFDGLPSWKHIGSLDIGDVVLISPTTTIFGKPSKITQLDRIVTIIRDWRLSEKLDPDCLVDLDKKSLWYLIGKLLSEIGPRIDFGRNTKFAEVLQIKALDAGVSLYRNKGVLAYPKEIESMFAAIEKRGFPQYDLTQRLESTWDNDLIYSLGADLSVLIENLPQDSHVRHYMKKTLRQAIQTRKLLKQVLKVLQPHVTRNHTRLEWSSDCWARYKMLSDVIERRWHLQKVARIEVPGKRWLYDFTIPEEKSFKSGPCFSHNTTLARIFARAILCKNRRNGVDPCNECPTCKEHLAGRSPNVQEINAADHNSIEDIRHIKEQIGQKSWTGNKKIFLLDEAHDLSSSAWDALLKILEEAGIDMKTVFMFCTTEVNKVPKTIISRSRILPISIPREAEVTTFLKRIATLEKISYDDRSLDLISRVTGGHLRDAVKELSVLSDLGITKFEEVLSYLGLDVKQDLFDLLLKLKTSPVEALDIVQKLSHRLTPFEVMSKLKEVLTEVLIKVLGVKFISTFWVTDDDVSMANQISQIYGDEINRVVDYIFSRVRKDYTWHELVLDFMVITQILNKKVEFSIAAQAGRIEKPSQVIVKEGFSSDSIRDMKKRMSDVGFLWGLARRPSEVEQGSKRDESGEVKIDEDQLRSDLGI